MWHQPSSLPAQVQGFLLCLPESMLCEEVGDPKGIEGQAWSISGGPPIPSHQNFSGSSHPCSCRTVPAGASPELSSGQYQRARALPGPLLHPLASVSPMKCAQGPLPRPDHRVCIRSLWAATWRQVSLFNSGTPFSSDMRYSHL